jgi:hypothetical protein
LTDVPNEVLSSIGDYLPESEFLAYQKTSKIINVANRSQTKKRVQPKMPYGSCAPLPEWARILKDINLFYFVPSFPSLLLEEQREDNVSPEKALASALYMANPDAGTGHLIEQNVNELKELFYKRDLPQLTFVAHRIVSLASRRHREEMLYQLSKLRELPYDIERRYAYGMGGLEAGTNSP